MRTQLFVCLAFVATLAIAKNATVGWQTVIPNTPSLITPISATTEKLYLFTSADSIMALNISNGAFIWSYGGFGTLALELSPLSVLHDRIPKVTYPNFVSTKNNTVTQYYVDVLYADSGTLLSRTKNISFFTSAVLNSDYLIVTSPPAGNSSTQNVTAFDIGTGKQRWVLPELAWFTTQSAVAANGVLIAIGVYLPYPQNKANPVSFAVHAFSEDTGAAFWTVPCTLFVADTATSVNASTTGAMYSERRRRLTKVDGGLLAVVNITNAVSPLNFSSTLFILSRTWGITLAALPLAHNQMITSGSFISGDRLVFTDGLTVLSCVDVAAQKFLWTTSLWIDPAFHPFSDVVSSISEAGDQILVQFTPAVSPTTNVSAPQPLNVTAFDTKTGKMQGSVVFPDSNALVLTPLLDGRLLVQSYRAGGFQVYSLLTGELIADYSWPTLAVGSVQLVRPGVVVGVDSTTDVAYQVFP